MFEVTRFARFFCLAALSTTPVIFEPGVSDREARALLYLPLVNGNGGSIIDYHVTSFADQVDVFFEIVFVTVFHPIELERFDNGVAGKLVERRIHGREAQTLFFPFCLLIDKARTGMQ